MLLDSPADVAEVLAWPGLLDRQRQTLLRDAHQFQRVFAHSSHRYRRRSVSHITFKRDTYVDREYVAFIQFVVRREAVNYLLIDRRANRIRKAVIAFEGGEGAGGTNHLFRRAIDLQRRDAGLDQLAQFL